jgi:hypothetical protein
VQASSGADVKLDSCTVAGSLGGSNLIVYGVGTRVKAHETLFLGDCVHGVYVAAPTETIVKLDNCGFIDGNRVCCNGKVRHPGSVLVDGKPVNRRGLAEATELMPYLQ